MAHEDLAREEVVEGSTDRVFGVVFPVVFFVIASWLLLNGGPLRGHVVSPIALGILFYAVLTPVGLMMRLTGKDPLRRSRDPGAASYWLPRRPPGPPPDSMTNQF